MKQGTTMLWEMIRLALSSIWAHKLRAFLTLLGIIIGVFSVVLVGTALETLERYVVDYVSSSLGSNTFTINRIPPNTDRETWRRAMRRNPRIDLEDYEFLVDFCRDCRDLAAYLSISQTVTRGSLKQYSTMVDGTTASAVYVSSIELQAGRFYTPDEVSRSARVGVLGADVAEQLFPNLDPLGKQVKVAGRYLKVIGVLEERGSYFGQTLDNELYIPISAYHRMFGSRQSLTIQGTASSGKFEDAMGQVRMGMRVRHKLRPDQEDDFAIYSTEELNASVAELGSTVQKYVFPVTFTALLVGGIVVMNIMLVSVSERTFEIGLRKSLGARKRDILLQFLIESFLLASIGGLIGMLAAAAGVAVGEAIARVPAQVSVLYASLGLGVSGGIGLAAGLYPALKAARLDPIEALNEQL